MSSQSGPAVLTVDGVNLECLWVGEQRRGAAPTIVMLHEGLGSVSMWKDFPQQLAHRTGCPVLAYSRQGHGESPPAALPREPDYMHHEGEVVLPALLQAAGVERPILFGHSDGGSIALIYAGRHPGAVAGLVLEAPHVFVEDLTIDSIAKGKTAYQTTDLGRRLGRYHRDVDHSFWGWIDIWLDPRFRAWNIESYLPAIDCPILMMQGLDDEYGTRAQLDSIVAHTGGGEIVMLERCGHSPHRDRTEAVLEHTARFVESLQPVPVP